METGKTGKYFKYAIGEIILVVIGILIALQINNWNNNNKNVKKEKEYLQNVIGDINTQRELVKAQIEHEKKMRLKCEKAISHINTNSINTDSLNTYLVDLTRKTFVIHNPTFQDLKSSGNILLIKDNVLRNNILSLNQFLDYSALVIQTNSETVVSDFRMFLVNEFVIDVNFKDSLTVAGGVDYSLKIVNIPWAKEVQKAQFSDKKHRLRVINQIAFRGRGSSVQLDIMNKLDKRLLVIKSEIETYLKL